MPAKKPSNPFIELAAKCQVLSDVCLVHARPSNRQQLKTKKAVEDSMASMCLTLKVLADQTLVDFENIVQAAETMHQKGKRDDTQGTEPAV